MKLLVACFCFLLAILGFWHHENLIAICFALGIGILVGSLKRRPNEI